MITSLFLSVIIRKQINGGERRFVFKRLVGMLKNDSCIITKKIGKIAGECGGEHF